MSELNAFTFGLGQYTEDGSPCVVAFDGGKNPRLASDEKFYLKSEADKVIKEKDKEIARLDDLAHAHNIELLRKENLIAELKAKLEDVQATAYVEADWQVQDAKEGNTDAIH